jgi:hypothetical protein
LALFSLIHPTISDNRCFALIFPDTVVAPEEDENRFYHERRLDGNG